MDTSNLYKSLKILFPFIGYCKGYITGLYLFHVLLLLKSEIEKIDIEEEACWVKFRCPVCDNDTTESCSHVITNCDLPCWIPTIRISYPVTTVAHWHSAGPSMFTSAYPSIHSSHILACLPRTLIMWCFFLNDSYTLLNILATSIFITTKWCSHITSHFKNGNSGTSSLRSHPSSAFHFAPLETLKGVESHPEEATGTLLIMGGWQGPLLIMGGWQPICWIQRSPPNQREEDWLHLCR